MARGQHQGGIHMGTVAALLLLALHLADSQNTTNTTSTTATLGLMPDWAIAMLVLESVTLALMLLSLLGMMCCCRCGAQDSQGSWNSYFPHFTRKD